MLDISRRNHRRMNYDIGLSRESSPSKSKQSFKPPSANSVVGRVDQDFERGGRSSQDRFGDKPENPYYNAYQPDNRSSHPMSPQNASQRT
jgi:hypothetical protein